MVVSQQQAGWQMFLSFQTSGVLQVIVFVCGNVVPCLSRFQIHTGTVVQMFFNLSQSCVGGTWEFVHTHQSHAGGTQESWEATVCAA